MTAKDATRLTEQLLADFNLDDWKVIVCCYRALATANGGDPSPNGGRLEGLTWFRIHTILLSDNYILDDNQALELIAHECAHAVSGDWRCDDSERFDAALKRTVQKLNEQVRQ